MSPLRRYAIIYEMNRDVALRILRFTRLLGPDAYSIELTGGQDSVCHAKQFNVTEKPRQTRSHIHESNLKPLVLAWTLWMDTAGA